MQLQQSGRLKTQLYQKLVITAFSPSQRLQVRYYIKALPQSKQELLIIRDVNLQRLYFPQFAKMDADHNQALCDVIKTTIPHMFSNANLFLLHSTDVEVSV